MWYLYANEGWSPLPVILLRVFYVRYLVVGSEAITEELLQSSRFHVEVHEHVVLQSPVHLGEHSNVLHPTEVVVAAGEEADDCSTPQVFSELVQGSYG